MTNRTDFATTMKTVLFMLVMASLMVSAPALAQVNTAETGLTNVQDWAHDDRIDITAGREAADGVLDPSDLIYTSFGPDWDEVDNDANGYTDDISGWDFFGSDNDAWNEWEDSYGTHGTGVMREAAAEGKNLGESRGGTIGICPNCAILPIRVGDSFVTDGQHCGEAIVFGVDSGAVALSCKYPSKV